MAHTRPLSLSFIEDIHILALLYILYYTSLRMKDRGHYYYLVPWSILILPFSQYPSPYPIPPPPTQLPPVHLTPTLVASLEDLEFIEKDFVDDEEDQSPKSKRRKTAKAKSKHEYELNDKVLAYHGRHRYLANIIALESEEEAKQSKKAKYRKYKIHFVGWPSEWDEWIVAKEICLDTPAGRRKQAELRLKHKNKVEKLEVEQAQRVEHMLEALPRPVKREQVKDKPRKPVGGGEVEEVGVENVFQVYFGW